MKEFWEGRSVLVTGHTGFKGSWLTLWLSQLGAQVTGYSLAPPTQLSNYVVARVRERVRAIHGDVCDVDRLRACIAEHRPQIVFHLAAQSLVRRSYQDPVETYRTNVLGTVGVLEAVRRTPGAAKAVVVVTSDKCYENHGWRRGYRESDPMGGYDPYSNSKGCAELVASAYRSSYFNPAEYARHGVAVGSARAGNVIGGGDWSIDRLIPDALRAHARNEELALRNPDAVRPWQFVLEPLHAYLVLAEHLVEDGPRYSEAWNFGPGDHDVVQVETVVAKLAERLQGGLRYRFEPRNDAHEAKLLMLDCTKAASRLGWKPKTTIDDAVRLIAEWENARLAGADMQDVCIGQILAFEARDEMRA